MGDAKKDDMITFRFWHRWLLGVSLYIVAFGFVLAVFPQSPLIDWCINAQVDPVFWQTAAMPEVAARFQAWVYGVLGATVAGWGVLMTFIVRIPFKRREPWAWKGLAGSFAVWYLIDTSLSAVYGVFFNVLFNTVLLLLVAVPLAFTRRAFSMGEKGRTHTGLRD